MDAGEQLSREQRDRIQRDLHKIRQLLHHGHSKLVKEAIRMHNSSYSSLRNWLANDEKAFSSHDVKKGVLARIAQSLPDHSNITRRTVYEFIISESGNTQHSQESITPYYGLYRIVHKLDGFHFHDLLIAHNASSNYPYFWFRVRIPDGNGGQFTRKTDGFVFASDTTLILSGIERHLDCLIYATKPFNPDGVFQGHMTLHAKELKKVFAAPIAWYRTAKDASQQKRKQTHAERWVDTPAPFVLEP